MEVSCHCSAAGSVAVDYKLVSTPVWDCIMASLSYWLAVEPCPSVSSSAACVPSNACLQQSLCCCVLVCLCLSNTTGLSLAQKSCDFHPECIVLSLPPAPPTQLSQALCACLCLQVCSRPETLLVGLGLWGTACRGGEERR